MNKNNTPFFPSLRAVLGPMRSSVSATRHALKEATLDQIEARLAPALDDDVLDKPAKKAHSRERIYSLQRVFWCWIWQILQAYTSCREVVRQVQALFVLKGWGAVDEGTAAYCQARAKVPLPVLEKALAVSHRKARQLARRSPLLQGRSLKVVDGSSLRAPDTPANRAAFPASKNQHLKPVFALVKVVVLFALESGTILARAVGSLHQSELRLLMGLGAQFAAGDILMGDRHFGCYLLAAWLRQFKADVIARVPMRSRKVDFRKTKRRLGPNDAIFIWKRPGRRSPLLEVAEWNELPGEMEIRLIRASIVMRGYRTVRITLMTTLLDAGLYPAAEIVSAYGRRWRLEMTIDDLKTSMGMEMLRGQTPAMLQREVLAFFVAHNFIRWLMVQAAQQGKVDLDRISFTGTMDALRQWCTAMARVHGAPNVKKRRLRDLWHELLRTLAADQVPLRPGRDEPRAVKKPRKYPPLNRPRRQYKGRLSRNTRRRIANAKSKAEKAVSLK